MSEPSSGHDAAAERRAPAPASAAASPVRHMTATGFLVWHGQVLLHWHRKNAMWLPFGGHLEENEDPVQAVLREIEEESGIIAELLPTALPFDFAMPRQLPPPVTILIERATDGQMWHEHIDLIYFCRPVAGIAALARDRDPTLRWLGAAALQTATPLSPAADEPPTAVSEDVRVLGRAAIDAARRAGN